MKKKSKSYPWRLTEVDFYQVSVVTENKHLQVAYLINMIQNSFSTRVSHYIGINGYYAETSILK